MVKLYFAVEDALAVLTESAGGCQCEFALSGLRPQCVAVDPLRPKLAYCGTFDDGLWRSDDGGIIGDRRGPALRIHGCSPWPPVLRSAAIAALCTREPSSSQTTKNFFARRGCAASTAVRRPDVRVHVEFSAPSFDAPCPVARRRRASPGSAVCGAAEYNRSRIEWCNANCVGVRLTNLAH
jgi:hypothetical protein